MVIALYYPKGPCSQIDIHRPQSTQVGTTLRPKYIFLATWTLRAIKQFRSPKLLVAEFISTEKCTLSVLQGIILSKKGLKRTHSATKNSKLYSKF